MLALPTSVSASFLTDLYAHYRKDRNSVDADWASFFESLGDDANTIIAELKGASWSPNQPANTDDPTILPTPAPAKDAKGAPKGDGGVSLEQLKAAVQDSARISTLMREFRVRGHLEATLDPLGLWVRKKHPELEPEAYGFTSSDLDRPMMVNALGLQTATLKQIVARLREIYSGKLGFEFMHIQDPERRKWLTNKIEKEIPANGVAKPDQQNLLTDLIKAEGLESFLQKKYTGTKRFGLEGGEGTICSIEEIVRYGSVNGINEIAIGMAHRGRLNVLTNVVQKPYVTLFAEFQGASANPDDVQGSGDVKYHMGYSVDRDVAGKKMHVSLTANPSHLEAVNPVVVGKVRAKQLQKKDEKRQAVMAILIHGDAAFPGQGVVGETLLLSGLAGYETGGTINIITNNQIGFTTTPEYGRFTPYPTEIAKSVQAPIIHVNGDDPDAIFKASRLAVDYRQTFGSDIVIDIICYRRHGHNESDEPAFTQPLMYAAIKNKATTLAVFTDQLVQSGAFTADEIAAQKQAFEDKLEQAFQSAPTYKSNKADMLDGAWSGFEQATSAVEKRGQTGVTEDVLKKLTTVITTVPSDFALNGKIARQFEAKKAAVSSGQDIDWATAEALAFGSLLNEDFTVRFTGQDVGRGTFSQRHAVLTDQNTNLRYVPLQHIGQTQGVFEIYESPLSEYAVMGFEYGFSLADPKALVLWEAQFGDFVNGAQIMIDQFIASAETKWLRMSGLTLLLPHGMEGQGPEHSSARLERFLQLCAEDNIQVANCSTPANYFHILRRQMHRKFRKPLVLMTPKSLLRHKLCVSPLADFSDESSFRRVIKDEWKDLDAKKVRRIVFCSGKVFYDLYQAREERGIKDVAIVRVEQLYPFPGDAIQRELEKYPKAEIVWCQEEPANQGAWTYIDRRMENVLVDMKYTGSTRPRYIGRPESAAPATGSLKRHTVEQAKIVDETLGK